MWRLPPLPLTVRTPTHCYTLRRSGSHAAPPRFTSLPTPCCRAELYGYGRSSVLFKPTKAAQFQFRPMASDAMSYFVGAGAVEGGYEEDAGFAINGGQGWSDVVFDNHQIELLGNTAVAMGNYYFTCATTGSKTKVEYTFGYKKNVDGKVRIFLHHSSVPFGTGAGGDPAPVTEAEVLEVQQKWATAIKTISAVHKAGGDFVGAAGDAAGELYGYGHGNVLFKPTKAAQFPFRPTGAEAMSYFVGNSNVDNGYLEDGGFAINGGKGWADVVYKNHQIELKNGLGIAMGSYDFTCATTGTKANVEYTFGYKRCDDGKVRIFLHHSSVPFVDTAAPAPALPAPVTEAEILEVQQKWAGAIKSISATHKAGGDFVGAAAAAAGELYGYGHGNVLFKPTKAAEFPFRPTGADAMSYFVGKSNVEDGYEEDGGFAINGGNGWADVVYKNHQIEIQNGVGVAMGTYDFTCATTGDKVTVEYTFGYKRCDDGKVRIYLHHSSVPFSTAPPAPAAALAPVTEAEVLEVQQKWANAIKSISATHKAGGDFVGAAGEAAGELYGYGHGNVLFKPTKAADFKFRPTGAEAMSYFVGNKNVQDGYQEDGGFAINGGNGWADVVYKNHQIELKGGVGIAMGTYDFTDATTGAIATVEYTFGYKRCDDGKVRIFLHHSSVPFSTAAQAPGVGGLAPVTEAEVREVQQKWAGAIKSISATYKAGGDFVGEAGAAAGELYGYGHGNVMFKPTKAAEFAFRPTGAEAMSYFVGCDNVQDGYKEDGGFAINGGNGWADCVYDNHNIELLGNSAIAMGTYVFTCATTGSKAKVEYTFGYKRCEDGKVRIFLHHSSVPFAVDAAPAKTSWLKSMFA